MIPAGAVLLSSRAPIGLVAITATAMCTNQGFKSLVCGPNLDPWYVIAWCRLRTSFFQSLGRGATFKEISKSIVERIEIPVPPLDLQREFGQRLRQFRAASLNRRHVRRDLDALFKTLLARAFTGDVTASWREVHMKELLQEMEQQAMALVEAR